MNSSHVERVFAYAAERGFSGADPFDALNGPLLDLLGRTGKWPRIALIQALKRCPLDLRPLLAVPPGVNPKGLGLYLGGLVRIQPPDQAARASAATLLDLLDRLRAPGVAGAAWGYNFPWQSRAFFLPRGTPTVVNTSIIGHAILDYADWSGDEPWRRLACSCADFILEDLNRTGCGDGVALSYSPLDETAILNATILGGGLLARIGELDSREDCRGLAAATVRCLLSAQRRDGSWPYAETSYQGWVDVFHTGFVLDALREIESRQPDQTIRNALKGGDAYFKRSFFDEKGEVRYYDRSPREADAHGYAQALISLTKMAPADEQARELARRVRGRFLARFVRADGRVRYRPERIWARGPHYMRWAQAWAFMGLAISDGDGAAEDADDRS